MEPATFLGMLGLGYWLSKDTDKKEGYENSAANSIPGADRTPPGAPTIPGLPRMANFSASGVYDIQSPLPSLGSYNREPYLSPDQGGSLHFPVPPSTLPEQFSGGSADLLQMRPDRWEDATDRPAFISPLTGLEFQPGEFKHANMVPFFRGQLKQNSLDSANNQVLDSYTGASKTLFAKREQTPFFEPTKDPIGNPYGMEAATDFLQSRYVEPKNRGGERPVEPIRVGKGLDDGYTELPSGGFQQTAGEEFMLRRMARTDDLRTANNPKLSYFQPVVAGAAVVTAPTAPQDIGEVRKNLPDKFYINKDGERNFVTVGADQKATIRSVQIVRNTTRPDTSKPYEGAAGQVEGKATYTIGSTRTPLAKQIGTWGFRNADLTENFNPDTDASENDYGKSGVEIRPNERFYTGERVMGLNVVPDEREVALPQQDFVRPTRSEETIDLNRVGIEAPVSAQPKLTVYDPNDVARTTIRETTEDNGYLGIEAPADCAQKLTVYDPDDIMKVTGRNTLSDWDWYRNFGRQDTPGSSEIRLQDAVRNTQKAALSAKSAWIGSAGQVESKAAEIRLQDAVRNTQKAALSAKSSWTGSAILATGKAEKDQTDARNMRQYAQKENIARGRTPKGSSVKLFNAEDNINMTFRRLNTDAVNDRENNVDRVAGLPSSTEVLGIQRPRTVLKLDVSAVRNAPIFVASLEENPYVIPLHKSALVGGENAI